MAMTFTYHRLGHIQKIVADWTSDACGDASGTTKVCSGKLIKAITNPGDAAPSDNYDINLTSDEADNLLQGCEDNLADRDTLNTEEVYFHLLDAGGMNALAIHPVVSGTIKVTVSNAGNANIGRVVLFIEGTISQ